MKTRSWISVATAAAVVMISGAPAALARGDDKNPRTRMVEKARQNEQSRQSAPSAPPPRAAPQPAPQRQASPPRQAEPSRTSTHQRVVERAMQSRPPTPAPTPQPARVTPAPQPSRSIAPSQPAPRVQEPARTSTHQRMVERATQPRATTPAPDRSSDRSIAPAPSNPPRTTNSANGGGRTTPSQGSTPTREIGRPIYRALEKNRESPRTESAPATPSRSITPDSVRSPSPVYPKVRPLGEMTPQQKSTAHARVVQRALDLRDSRPVDTIDERDDDRDFNSDGDGPRDRFSGSFRHDGRRDWDRDDWRHDRGRSRRWDRDRCDSPSWSWGLSIGFSGSWSFGASYNWNSSCYRPSWCDWRPRRYYYQPCDWYWDGCRPHVSFVVGRPLWCSPRYYSTSCCWEIAYSPYHSAWCSAGGVTTYVPVYLNDSYGTIGSVETYTNDYVPASSPVYPVAAASPPTTYQPIGSAPVATTYRATTNEGVMDWADTPARIMEAISIVSEGQRAATAGRFLGRSVAGAWELVFERSQPAGPRTMLLCTARGASATPSPVIALLVDQPPADLKAGAVLVATGRLAEISLNDPEAPNGVLVLEDARIAR